MSNFLTPAAAYLNRRNDLLAERSVVESPADIKLINKALMASEIAMATFHNLEALKTLQQRRTRSINWHDVGVRDEIERFEMISNALAHIDAQDEQAFLAYQAAFFQLSANFSWQHASPQMVQNDLFTTTFALWLETLEELFALRSRKLIFIRVEKILTFSVGRLPILGEATEIYRMLRPLIQESNERTICSEEWFHSLESYTEAANLCSRAILIFCFATEAVLRGHALPDKTLMNAKIKGHYDSVIEGTHPSF
ncbi:hypothetical protein ACQK5W_11735 [Pantoea sp. FN060301]|uniref:hypothetical protein n=1 Tax=Pantoea sp. FN060301 TaxID=3420380 RepID=UPI003D178D29